MSTANNQSVLPSVEVRVPADLNLRITALETAVVRMPHSAGAMNLRATKTIFTVR